MATKNLDENWQEVVASGDSYLLQSKGAGQYLLTLSTGAPTSISDAFTLNGMNSVSSTILPASEAIWCRTEKSGAITLVVETW